MLNEVMRADILGLFLILGGRLAAFLLLPFRMILTVGFSLMPFVGSRKFPSIPSLLSVFIVKQYKVL